MDALIAGNVEGIRRISRDRGAQAVRVFGSRARGQGAPGSDLDLLVDLAPGRDLLDLVAIKQDLEALLGCHVDVVTEPALSPHMREQILREAEPL
ncbi:MAG: nucleotidyltransferase family protein [Deltaproteobacteria bacterium]|nr:nucleotidyltransferase family protein [Deltaproteobacteria bacterium]